MYYTSWSNMSKVLQGRTENSIKNYFYSSIRRLKSNPISNIIRDIYLSQKTSLDEIQENNFFIREEILKLNPLSQSICKIFFKENYENLKFRDFLLEVIFSKELKT